MTRCRDCALYDLDAVKNARGAVMSDRVGRCLWVSAEAWPQSIMRRSPERHKGSYMTPNDEHNCQTFVPRKDEK